MRSQKENRRKRPCSELWATLTLRGKKGGKRQQRKLEKGQREWGERQVRKSGRGMEERGTGSCDERSSSVPCTNNLTTQKTRSPCLRGKCLIELGFSENLEWKRGGETSRSRIFCCKMGIKQWLTSRLGKLGQDKLYILFHT